MAESKRTLEEEWRCVLEGEISGHFCWKPWVRRVSRAIPSEPRCKLCHTPFGAPGSVLRFVGFGPSRLNRRICSACIGELQKRPGGAQVTLSFLFADVRGSTSLAEQMGAVAFAELMARFYGAAAGIIDERDGVVDKFVGDEVVALFIPGFVGPDHAAVAVTAAQELLLATGHGDSEPWIPIGAAVHTGEAFVGSIGEQDALDFTALGDSVNTTARLAASAAAGEVIVSRAAATAASLHTEGLEERQLEVRGKTDSVDVWVVSADRAQTPTRAHAVS